jgi:hypothetical protein
MLLDFAGVSGSAFFAPHFAAVRSQDAVLYVTEGSIMDYLCFIV